MVFVAFIYAQCTVQDKFLRRNLFVVEQIETAQHSCKIADLNVKLYKLY